MPISDLTTSNEDNSCKPATFFIVNRNALLRVVEKLKL